MPNLTTLHYNSENLTFKYDVSVDKQGNFTTTIPKEVSEKLIKIGVDLSSNRLNNIGFFSEKSLHELEKKVKETADKYSKKKLVDEKIVIKYAVDINCTYCKGVSGALYPDGKWEQDAEGAENGYHWIDGTHKNYSMDCGPYSLDIAFEIMKAKTWEFPSGEKKTQYVSLEDSDTKDDELLRWLTSLRKLSTTHSSEVKEIEYTTEIGLLFKGMVLFIFNINERIHSIFGEQFDLSKIEPLKLKSGNPLFDK